MKNIKHMLRQHCYNALVYLVALIVTLIYVFPYIWMFLSSFKTSEEIFSVPLKWLPSEFRWNIYVEVLTETIFPRIFLNTICYTVTTTLIVVYSSALTGYALAKLRFRGRELYFLFCVATMMVPFFVLIIPLYRLMVDWGLANTLYALILPHIISPFGIFLMRQFMITIPNELLDSARIDGASELSILHRICFPLIKSACLVLGLITFLNLWMDFLWPLVVLHSQENFVMEVYLQQLQQFWGGNLKYYGRLMAASTIATLPIIVFLALTNKYIVKGIALTGLKK